MESENLQFDEKLSETVRKFPCLFDKTSADYKDKNTIRTAWAKVAEELHIEDGKVYLASSYISGDL